MQPHYYQSSRVKSRTTSSRNTPPHKSRRLGSKSWLLLFVVFLIVGGLGLNHFMGPTKADAPALTAKKIATKLPAVAAKNKPAAALTPVAAAVNPCAGNSLSQLILVSISARHLYACQGSIKVYDSPVVTGISYLAADLTPTGTYHIYAKETDQVLKGCDTTGCWDDNVSYWMPFLDNQYGEYGFHDATWRAPGDFGNINPDSADASHGCVECPLATAKWLYGWAQVGTAVTIES
jgi:lipoprotein-anchoring transpeptidase ErfK/SrfK